MVWWINIVILHALIIFPRWSECSSPMFERGVFREEYPINKPRGLLAETLYDNEDDSGDVFKAYLYITRSSLKLNQRNCLKCLIPYLHNPDGTDPCQCIPCSMRIFDQNLTIPSQVLAYFRIRGCAGDTKAKSGSANSRQNGVDDRKKNKKFLESLSMKKPNWMQTERQDRLRNNKPEIKMDGDGDSQSTVHMHSGIGVSTSNRNFGEGPFHMYKSRKERYEPLVKQHTDPFLIPRPICTGSACSGQVDTAKDQGDVRKLKSREQSAKKPFVNLNMDGTSKTKDRLFENGEGESKSSWANDMSKNARLRKDMDVYKNPYARPSYKVDWVRGKKTVGKAGEGSDLRMGRLSMSKANDDGWNEGGERPNSKPRRGKKQFKNLKSKGLEEDETPDRVSYSNREDGIMDNLRGSELKSWLGYEDDRNGRGRKKPKKKKPEKMKSAIREGGEDVPLSEIDSETDFYAETLAMLGKNDEERDKEEFPSDHVSILGEVDVPQLSKTENDDAFETKSAMEKLGNETDTATTDAATTEGTNLPTKSDSGTEPDLTWDTKSNLRKSSDVDDDNVDHPPTELNSTPSGETTTDADDFENAQEEDTDIEDVTEWSGETSVEEKNATTSMTDVDGSSSTMNTVMGNTTDGNGSAAVTKSTVSDNPVNTTEAVVQSNATAAHSANITESVNGTKPVTAHEQTANASLDITRSNNLPVPHDSEAGDGSSTIPVPKKRSTVIQAGDPITQPLAGWTITEPSGQTGETTFALLEISTDFPGISTVGRTNAKIPQSGERLTKRSGSLRPTEAATHPKDTTVRYSAKEQRRNSVEFKEEIATTLPNMDQKKSNVTHPERNLTQSSMDATSELINGQITDDVDHDKTHSITVEGVDPATKIRIKLNLYSESKLLNIYGFLSKLIKMPLRVEEGDRPAQIYVPFSEETSQRQSQQQLDQFLESK